MDSNQDYIDPEYAAKKEAREPLMRAIMHATTDEERWTLIQLLDQRAVADSGSGSIVFVLQEWSGPNDGDELDEE